MKTKLLFLLLLLFLQLVPMRAQNNVWLGILSAEPNRYSQSWRTRTYFPKDEIQEGWDEDRQITNLTYGDGVWALVMAKGTGYSGQSWRTRTYFPKDEIQEGWDEGRQIISLSYGDGVWALVMAKGTGYSGQSWRTRTYFPKDEIQEGWDEGRQITSLTYGDGVWALVMSKGTDYSNQSWRTRTYFPKDEIQEGWDEGRQITSLSYGDGVWALVMSRGTGYSKQQWLTRTYFPKDEIQEGWDANKNITWLGYGKYETSPSAPPPTIHFIVFTDTEDSRIGSACRETNLYFKNNLVPKLERYSGCAVQTYFYSGGNDFTLQRLNKFLNDFNSSRNDAIFFYFAGHGYNRRINNYPTLTLGLSGDPLESRQMDLLDLYNTLRGESHRLLVVMAEACNKEYSSRNEIRSNAISANFTPYEDNPDQFISLFKASSGDYLMSSSSRNQLSHLATGQPGFFTCAFWDALAELTERSYYGAATWSEILNRTTSKTTFSANQIGEEQIPQWCTGANCY